MSTAVDNTVVAHIGQTSSPLWQKSVVSIQTIAGGLSSWCWSP